MGAGTCDDHMALSVATQLAHLPPGAALTTHVQHEPPHAWAEQATPTPEGVERIVLDAWAEGPAILAEDGAFSARPDAIEDVRVTQHEVGVLLAAHQATRQFLASIPDNAPAALEARVRVRLGHDEQTILRPEYPPMAVMSPLALFLAMHRADRSLAQRAAVGDASAGSLAQLDAAQAAAEAEGAAPVVPAGPLSVRDPLRPVRTALAAAGVARSLGSTVAEATALAGPIEQAARSLRTRVRFPPQPASPEAQMATAHAVPPTAQG